jgi:oxygen-independent coproporphyrinogen-3 oxidase
MKNIENNKTWFETEILTKIDKYNEMILTGLRTNKGLNINKLNDILKVNEDFYKQINKYCSDGFMEKNDQIIKLTLQGYLHADKITADLFKVNNLN